MKACPGLHSRYPPALCAGAWSFPVLPLHHARNAMRTTARALLRPCYRQSPLALALLWPAVCLCAQDVGLTKKAQEHGATKERHVEARELLAKGELHQK